LPEYDLIEEGEWTYGRRTGVRLVTDHFEIYTTVDDEELQFALPMFLEAAYTQYTELVPPLATDGPRLETYIFANRAEWDRYVRENYPQRYRVYSRISEGGFADRNRCVAYYIRNRRIHTLSVIAHEGFHQYLGAMFSRPVPAWLNEGLACYCETFEVQKDVPVFTPTRNAIRANCLRASLASDSLLPLEEILATDAGRVIVRNKSAMTRAYYAQAWGLICMLRHGEDEKYRAGFEQMCADIGTRDFQIKAQAARIAAPEPDACSPGEALFRAYITTDLDAFEEEYHRYLREIVSF
jgi:hypothetical protein